MSPPRLTSSLLIISLLSTLFFGCSSSREPEYPTHLIGAYIPASNLGISIDQSLIVPYRTYSRKYRRKMRPRYITIHSTQNRAYSADARMHAIALNRGRLRSRNNSLGYLSWHYTVDESVIYQSLPDNEQGQHADYEGPGNRYSIGIEMCENRGNSRNMTLDRTARLVAYLMRKYRIPLENVVPHQHWRMVRYSDGKDLGYKNCPHFLMDSNGQPGVKWYTFKQHITKYL